MLRLLSLLPLPAFATKNFADDGWVEALVVLAVTVLSTGCSVAIACHIFLFEKESGVLPALCFITSLPLLIVSLSILDDVAPLAWIGLIITLCIWLPLYLGTRRKS